MITDNSPEGSGGSQPSLAGKDENYGPMSSTGPFAMVEALLKHPGRIIHHLHRDRTVAILGWLLAITLVCAVLYGLVVGSFTEGRQLFAASAKVTIAIFVGALFCLPSLYIFACLNGADVRISEACGLLAGVVALSSVLLIGFAPVAWVFSESTNSAVFMGGLHLTFWAIGTWFGLRLLYRGLSYMKSAHTTHLHVWVVVFVAVCLQLTTSLRPIMGTADRFLPTEKKFFLVHWWECIREEKE